VGEPQADRRSKRFPQHLKDTDGELSAGNSQNINDSSEAVNQHKSSHQDKASWADDGDVWLSKPVLIIFLSMNAVGIEYEPEYIILSSGAKESLRCLYDQQRSHLYPILWMQEKCVKLKEVFVQLYMRDT
jgi:hypothetical protein